MHDTARVRKREKERERERERERDGHVHDTARHLGRITLVVKLK